MTGIATEFERVELPLADAFTISRGTTTTAENVLVRITYDGATGAHDGATDAHDDVTGVGNAAPSAHYGETADTVVAVLPDLLAAVEEVGDPFALQRIEREMARVVGDNPAARAAVDIALHDLVGKLLDVPLHRLWGLDPDGAVATSFTIGIDDTDRMVEKTGAAVEAGYSILKVKLGTDRDREIVRAIRGAAPDARIRVDANEAWTPREAVAMCEFLADHGVEFVEQPIPAENDEGQRLVYERSPLPVAADESCVTLSDVPRIAGRADIANLKLMKCGGLREARRMIAAARAHGLEVMLGCMVESSASIAAGAQLAPLLDYADLDGSLLLAEDPFDGPVTEGGAIDLAGQEGAGTGAREGR